MAQETTKNLRLRQATRAIYGSLPIHLAPRVIKRAPTPMSWLPLGGGLRGRSAGPSLLLSQNVNYIPFKPKRRPLGPSFVLRAENETRTRDPDLGKVVLYQLSYFRIAVLGLQRYYIFFILQIFCRFFLIFAKMMKKH